MLEDQNNEKSSIKRSAADIASMMLYATWMILLLWDETIYSLVAVDSLNGIALRLLAFMGMLFGLALAQATCRPLMAAGIHPPVVWRVAAGAAMPLAGLCALANALVASTPMEITVVCWIMAGAGGSWMLMVSGLKLCLLETDRAMQSAYHSSALAACMGFAVLLLPAVGQAIAICVLPVLSAVAAWLGKPADMGQLEHLLRNDRTLRGTAQNIERRRLQVQMFACSFVFAAVQYTALVRFGDEYNMGYVCVALLLSALFAALHATALVGRSSIGSLQLTFLALASVGTIVLYMTDIDDAVFLVICAATVFGFEGYNSVSKYSLSRTVIVRDLSYTKHFVSGRAANVAGLIAGWGTCAAAGIGARFVSDSMLLCVPAIVSTLLIAVLIYCNRGGTMTLSALSEGAGDSGGAADAWELACGELERSGELTNREREVFRLLVRGRDARYISDALYISVHTAKSHVSHIYQKLGVGNHQGLITLVEQKCELIENSDN